MKALVFDSSSIITLALNNLLNMLMPLKKKFRGRFFITPEIREEIVNKPMKLKKFELEALMISGLIKEGILEIVKDDISKETDLISETANNIFRTYEKNMKIVHYGEASCVALCNLLKKKGHDATLVIDERTTRMLCENPDNLQKLFEKKLHTNVVMDRNKTQLFRGISIIRSSELCFAAYKYKIIKLPATPAQAIDALLYASKCNGCSISSEEIEKAKRLI